MDELYLISPKLKVTDIKRATTAKHFKDLKVGDTFRLRISVFGRGRGSRGAYANYYEISVNGNEFVETSYSPNMIKRYMSYFELEVI